MKLDFMIERDKDLLNAYDEVLKKFGESAPYKSRQEIFDEVANSEAKQFYVSPEEAIKIISRINKGRDCGIKNIDRRKMYYDIYELFVSLKQQHPCISMRDAIYKIIYSAAPCFYLKRTSMKVIFHKIQKRSKFAIQSKQIS